MSRVIDGVLVPSWIQGAERVAEYVENVREQNRIFREAYHTLEDECERIGLTIEDLDR